MSLPFLQYHPNIKINITDNRHFALAYLLGITRPTFTRSPAQELSLYIYYSRKLETFLNANKMSGKQNEIN